AERPRWGDRIQEAFVERAYGRWLPGELSHGEFHICPASTDDPHAEIVVRQAAEERLEIGHHPAGLGGSAGELHTMEGAYGQTLGAGVHDERQQPVPQPGPGRGS